MSKIPNKTNFKYSSNFINSPIKPLDISLLYSDKNLTFSDGTAYLGYIEDGEDIVEDLSIFLSLSEEEKNIVEHRKKKGYTLIGERQVGLDYPDYIKYFFSNYPNLIVDGQELSFKRTKKKSYLVDGNENDRELIFVKFKDTIEAEETKKELDYNLNNFSARLLELLSNNN